RRFAEAEQQFQAALQLAPQTPAAYRDLAAVYDILGKRPQAVKILQQASQIMPDNPDAYRLLGEFYFSIGDMPNALAEYASLDKDHPKDLRVQEKYIELLLLGNRLDEASRLDQELRRQDPSDVYWLILHGRILSAQNNFV